MQNFRLEKQPLVVTLYTSLNIKLSKSEHFKRVNESDFLKSISGRFEGESSSSQSEGLRGRSKFGTSLP